MDHGDMDYDNIKLLKCQLVVDYGDESTREIKVITRALVYICLLMPKSAGFHSR